MHEDFTLEYKAVSHDKKGQREIVSGTQSPNSTDVLDVEITCLLFLWLVAGSLSSDDPSTPSRQVRGRPPSSHENIFFPMHEAMCTDIAEIRSGTSLSAAHRRKDRQTA